MTDLDIIPVKINGKTYRTALYDNVQRFVPNGVVDYLVTEIVRDQSQFSMDLYNNIAIKVLHKEISLDDYIEFHTFSRGSIQHFVDSLSSIIDLNPNHFDGTFEELVVIKTRCGMSKKQLIAFYICKSVIFYSLDRLNCKVLHIFL